MAAASGNINNGVMESVEIIDHIPERSIGVNKYGVMEVPDIKIPPLVLRNVDNDDETILPIVPLEFTVPKPLVAMFSIVNPLELERVKKDDGAKKIDRFNDLGKNIPRDTKNRVKNTKEIIEKMNDINSIIIWWSCFISSL
jgi:hypothetical protein